MSLTAADLDTIRFMRAKNARAAMIMQTFGFKTVDALLDAVLGLACHAGRPAAPTPLPITAATVESAPPAEAAPRRRRAKGPCRADSIREMLAQGKKPTQIAEALGIKPGYVYVIVSQDRAKARKAAGRPAVEPKPRPKPIVIAAAPTPPPPTAPAPAKARPVAPATPEEAAFGRAVAGYYANLMRSARALTRSTEAAQDLVQDTIARALEKRELFDPGTNLGAWLYTMMRNLHINGVRKSRPTSALEDVGELEIGVHAGGQIDALRLRDLRRALDELPEKQREAVLAIGLDGSTYDEAAGALNVSVGTVKSRLSRGRQALGRMLGERVAAMDEVAA
jgi:RNA polymerase sigma factor (sigma-70 family)